MRNVPHRDLGTPTHICILMLVDPMEIERFPVNEELALCHSHSANPHRESVEVRHRPRCRLCSQLYLEKPSTGMRHSRWPEPRIAYPSARKAPCKPRRPTSGATSREMQKLQASSISKEDPSPTLPLEPALQTWATTSKVEKIRLGTLQYK